MIKTLDNFAPAKDTTPEATIAILANCNCCDAHKNNKPTTLGVWTELPKDHAPPSITNKDSYGTRKCLCDCRHNARFICRKFCIT